MGYLTGNFLSGRYSTRVGIHRMMVGGGCTVIFGLVLVLSLFAAGIQTPLAFFGPMFFVGGGNGLTLPSANPGHLSARPNLVCTASGLGATLIVGGGGALAGLTGALLNDTTGAWPVIGMMLASSILALLAAFYTRRVEQSLVEAEG